MTSVSKEPDPIERFVTIPKKGFKELSTRSFRVKIKGKVFEGFVVRKEKKYFAYQNLCQHLPITLDLKDNNFFSHDKKLLQCHMHGALYEIETGFCVGGPCEGTKLIPLTVLEEENELVIEIPSNRIVG